MFTGPLVTEALTSKVAGSVTLVTITALVSKLETLVYATSCHFLARIDSSPNVKLVQ